ncbi:MAG TPA: hypothetical protein VJ814_07645, partial [Gaiellaceae bacterium]|nr:hypothetical protein [Gaiellaceae bacterium]
DVAATIAGRPRAVLPARGESTPFSVEVGGAVGRVRWDPSQSIPAPVRDATLERKRALERRAYALRSAGRIAEALDTYREALAEPLELPPEEAKRATRGNLAWWTQGLDGRIHLALAEIALDQGREADAEAELSNRDLKIAADAEKPVELRRRILRARLSLRRGDVRETFSILRDVLGLDFVQRETDTVGDALRRQKFREQAEGRGGDYLLLAAAAALTERPEIAREAAREAVRRGADTSLLEDLNAREGAPAAPAAGARH